MLLERERDKTMANNISEITTKHAEYQKFSPCWEQLRDVIAGDKAVKDKGAQYLPPINPDDTKSDVAYTTYLQGADFYNATGLTRDTFSGLIFRKNPIIDPSIPEEMRLNIDAEGTPIDAFLEETVDEVIDVGRVVLVGDLPMFDGIDLTISERSALGSRVQPYIKMYVTESFINWKYKIVNGVRVLVLAVFLEKKDVATSIFTHETENQYRVFRIVQEDAITNLGTIKTGDYIQEVYDENGKIISQITPKINGQTLSELPVQVINSDSLTADVSKPPLLDLSNTNLSHYRNSADLGACLRMFGRITPVFGVPENQWDTFHDRPLLYGSTNSISLPMNKESGTPLYGFLEPKSDFTSVISQSTRLEERMSAQGARMLAPQKRGVEAAETVRLDMIGETSIVQGIATSVSNGINSILKVLLGSEIDIQLNTDLLGKAIDAQLILALLQTLQAGKITEQQFMDSLQKGEAVAPIEDVKNVEISDEEPEIIEPQNTGNAEIVQIEENDVS